MKNTAMNYQYTLCEESCVELFYSFEGDNYKHDRENFIEIGNNIFCAASIKPCSTLT